MKLRIAVLAACAISVSALAATPSGCVTVRTRGDSQVPHLSLLLAEETATRLFKQADIALRWAPYTPSNGAAPCVVVSVSYEMDFSDDPEVLAKAAPYQPTGTQIHIYLNRVLRRLSTQLNGLMLGYVLAHELGHVLEGMTHHSGEGIMKARWSGADFGMMYGKVLSFSDLDRMLLRARFQ